MDANVVSSGTNGAPVHGLCYPLAHPVTFPPAEQVNEKRITRLYMPSPERRLPSLVHFLFRFLYLHLMNRKLPCTIKTPKPSSEKAQFSARFERTERSRAK
jgi:hypothetical protein